MVEMLEITVDKFTFKVAADRLYSPEGMWVKQAGSQVRIGLSDYVQQRSGDVAFTEVRPAGETVQFGEEVATMETIKVNISLPSPVSGKIIEVNPVMSTAPETINQDPYEAGWLAVIEAADWEADKARLLDAQSYFSKMKRDAELEIKK
jgi:glycine cleavage system H protein